MNDLINNTDRPDSELEDIQTIVDSARAALEEMALEQDMPLSELCGLVVAIDTDVVCMVLPMGRRAELVDELRRTKTWPPWPELDEQVRALADEPAMGKLRAIVVMAGPARACLARVQVQIHEGGSA